jgi:diguanylate cyclase (GGDEF)-like protein
VFDAKGRLTIDASSLDPVPEDRSDEEYFRVHREHPDIGLFISKPMLHRSAYAIVLSRRITGPDGSFLGVVAGSIRFSYFHDLFGRLSLNPGDIITVLRRDRTMIMRTPFDLDVIGKNLAERSNWNPANLQGDESYAGVGPVDGIARLYVRRSGTSPLYTVVGKPLDGIFSLWRTEAIRIGAIMTALILFVLGTTLFLAREIGRRARAEDKLEELATTDALTGLKNRRKFDSEIDAEWRRAARNDMPVALLMIDADHFKSYNDTYGHQAGDQVLVGIAICISDSVRRAGDCPARFGGEEFAVLLPGLSAMQAVGVAETIRLKVECWSEDPTATTVSIGAASMTPAAGDALVRSHRSRRQGAVRSQGQRPQPDGAGECAQAVAGGLGRGRAISPVRFSSLRATGSRECAPDDRLREAIHRAAKRKNGLLRRYAPRNDGN